MRRVVINALTKTTVQHRTFWGIPEDGFLNRGMLVPGSGTIFKHSQNLRVPTPVSAFSLLA